MKWSFAAKWAFTVVKCQLAGYELKHGKQNTAGLHAQPKTIT